MSFFLGPFNKFFHDAAVLSKFQIKSLSSRVKASTYRESFSASTNCTGRASLVSAVSLVSRVTFQTSGSTMRASHHWFLNALIGTPAWFHDSFQIDIYVIRHSRVVSRVLLGLASLPRRTKNIWRCVDFSPKLLSFVILCRFASRSYFCSQALACVI